MFEKMIFKLLLHIIFTVKIACIIEKAKQINKQTNIKEHHGQKAG